MRKRRDEEAQVEELEEVEISEKEQKKLKQKEIIEKRKNAKRKDKVARWGGIILLGLIMFVGFLLWVAGEMKDEQSNTIKSTNPVNQRITPPMNSSTGGTVIVR